MNSTGGKVTFKVIHKLHDLVVVIAKLLLFGHVERGYLYYIVYYTPYNHPCHVQTCHLMKVTAMTAGSLYTLNLVVDYISLSQTLIEFCKNTFL